MVYPRLLEDRDTMCKERRVYESTMGVGASAICLEPGRHGNFEGKVELFWEDHMIEFERGNFGDGMVLKLSGELTVPHAAQAKSVLLEALERLDYLEIDLSLVTAVDIAGLQLLCAAHKTAVTRGKRIVAMSASDYVDLAAKEAGFLRHEGCITSPNEGCLWAEGGRRWAKRS